MAPTAWMADLKQAARTLLRTPGFTLTSAGMLGLALGACAGMYAIVDTVLLEPLPYSEPERIVHIAATAPGSEFPEEFGVSAEFYVQYAEQSKLLEHVATYNSFTNTMRTADRVERIRMSFPTNSVYDVLGVSPVLGRLPVESDENGVVVISHALWTNWFNQDPGVLGRSYDIGGASRTVIGVMGPGFRFPNDDTMLWIAGTIQAEDITQVGRFGMDLVGRLAPGATPEMVEAELTALAARLPGRFGGTPAYARTIAQHRAVVRPLTEQFLGRAAGPLWVLMAAAAIVLLIACANVANLFLVRGEARHRELALRRTLGASRRQLVRLQMAEALIVAALAAALAVGLAAAFLRGFLSAAPPTPRMDLIAITPEVLLFTVLAALLSALACGGMPALRGAAPDLARLRDGGRGATRGRRWSRDLLVAGQTALALVLLIGSGLLLRSAWALNQVDPGYRADDLFTFQIAPDRPSLDSAPAYARFNLGFMERLRALPGVEQVGLVENVPLQEGTASMPVRVEDTTAAGGEGALLNFTYTAGDYFPAMDIALLSGRLFTDADQGTALGNVILSRSAAERLWPGEDPIGKRLKRDGGSEWETVVGVVEDVMQDSLQEAPQALLYLPMVGPVPEASRAVSSPGYVVRTRRADTIAADIRALVREVAPEAPMYREHTMAALVEQSMVRLTFTLLTLGMAAVLALVLGAVGLYGVLSYIVAERTREIGVRMALGAGARQVRGMVVSQGARVLAAGVVLGLLAALAFTRTLSSLLFEVQPLDAATFVGMSAMLAAVGLLASYIPARKASNLHPLDSLRRE